MNEVSNIKRVTEVVVRNILDLHLKVNLEFDFGIFSIKRYAFSNVMSHDSCERVIYEQESKLEKLTAFSVESSI